MRYHIERFDPATHEPVVVNDVTVTAVHQDGTYNITAPGWGECRNLSPDSVPLRDENGNPADLSKIVLPISSELLQRQLLETQAALATMYEALTEIVSGGGM